MAKRFFVSLGALVVAFSMAIAACSSTGGGAAGPAGDRVVDVVVVGSGIAGNLAALGAKEGGAARVLLIEKQAYYGGSSRTAGGGMSQYEARQKPEEFFGNWREHSLVDADFPFPNYGKLYSVAAEIPNTIDFLTSLGINFTFRRMPPPRLMYAQAEGGGAGLLAKLEDILKSQGIEILMECKAEKLIVENGVVTGLNAAYKGQDLIIRAKNVILATGGFSYNPELVAQWAGGIDGLNGILPRSDAGNTGDGILMALEAGAALYNINGTPSTFTDATAINFRAGWIFGAPVTPVTVVGSTEVLLGSPTLSYQIVVDPQGRRFTNEAQPTGSSPYVSVIHNMILHGRGPYYVIYDSNNPNLVSGNTADINTVLDAVVAAIPGEAFKADTVSALAAAIGAPGLTETVRAYNAANADAFGKDPEFVKDLATGPFYAVKVYPLTLGSMGGVMTDITGKVLDAGGKPIPRLYAAGEASNRDFYGQAYIGGGSLGLYSTMGRRAGKDAAANR